ncbi:MAG TPA: protein-glutamate O-methyltransferase CheR [Kofleriaceae bacterium]|jgi:chemotaxis protein methyltransferase CheR|nr:protein-glutamate O-methyltransferase CheR [Kofleriaceae bacterium]
MPESTLSPQLFALFSGLVEDSCGIYYGNDRSLFAAKLHAHAAEVGHDSLLDYYYRLRYDDPTGIELASLIEALLVHETYFFRELAPLEQLAGHLAEVVRTRGRARVWSAACSTGEEPFTLAMLLDARDLLDRVELIGTDVSVTAVARARSGLHSRRALRDGHPAELARRYLETGAAGVALAPRIRDAVTFHTLNLFDPVAIAGLGRFDAILCRNVLIYFRDQQIVRAIDHLASALMPDGLIAVGVSESLLRFGTALSCEERGRSFFYRRAP